MWDEGLHNSLNLDLLSVSVRHFELEGRSGKTTLDAGC